MRMYDAVVVGAGILGLATAYHMKRLRPEDNIVVLERLAGPGMGNTSKSAGMFRSFFYSKTNLTLADTSIEFYRHVHEELKHDLGIKWTGYLWLYDEETYRRAEPVLKDMASRGVEYTVYEGEEIAQRLGMRRDLSGDVEAKVMGLANVDYGVLVPKAGAIDVDALARFYASSFVKMGGEIRYKTPVKRLVLEPRTPMGLPGEPYFWQDGRVVGVETADGQVIKARKTVVAAGVWSIKLLDQVGVDGHFKPKKRQLFSVRAETEELRRLLYTKDLNPEGCMPFLILPRPRVYIKPVLEENAFWLSYADEFGRPFQLEDEPKAEENYYRYGIYPIVTKYLPQFEGHMPYASWAGLYAINTLDGQPVIFEENNLLVVGGASGSGIMKADAIGRIAASLYIGEEHAELYGGARFRVSDLGMEKRRVEPEKLVI